MSSKVKKATHEFMSSIDGGLTFRTVSFTGEKEAYEHILSVADADGRSVRSLTHGRGWQVTSTIAGETNWVWRWLAL